jgi:hypothetical protein
MKKPPEGNWALFAFVIVIQIGLDVFCGIAAILKHEVSARAATSLTFSSHC